MKLFFALLILLLLTAGCGRNCDKEIKKYRTFDYSIHVKSHYFFGRFFLIEGINLRNGNRQKHIDVGSWYPAFITFINDGDTVVKHKNELMFYIHKKDTVLAFPFDCDGQIIK